MRFGGTTLDAILAGARVSKANAPWRNAHVDLIWNKTEGPFLLLIVCRTAAKTQAAGVCNYLFFAR